MARRKPPIIPDQFLDQLLAGSSPKSAFAKDGLLDELKKALAERALNAEIDHHLDNGESDGHTNSRKWYGRKTVLTDTGKIALDESAASPWGTRSPWRGGATGRR